MLHYCCVVSVAIRAEPRHQAEQISQALWGEALEILNFSNEWARIQCTWDGYSGWIPCKAIMLCSSLEESAWTISSDFAQVLDLKDGSVLLLSMGSRLRSALLPKGFQMLSGSAVDHESYTKNQAVSLREIGLPWLGTPYLWGGRSRFGIDCSGFTQMIMARFGHAIPRDAKEQWAMAPQRIQKPEYDVFEEGQLAFFGPSLDRISHVGIVLGPDTILHASGRVRIDRLSQQGISLEIPDTNRSTKLMTHTIQGIATYK
ncbi:MAG: NlpC/P60 family protein [Sphingomonadales bacterium]|nr:NlpC/P60 family protein [Sphingomonadales bacterium]